VKYGLETTRVTANADAEMVVPHSLDFTRKTTTLQATAESLAVSVLDLVATRAGEPAGSAIVRSVELARHVEQLWLASSRRRGRLFIMRQSPTSALISVAGPERKLSRT